MMVPGPVVETAMIASAKPKIPLAPPRSWPSFFRRYPSVQAWLKAHPGQLCGRVVNAPPIDHYKRWDENTDRWVYGWTVRRTKPNGTPILPSTMVKGKRILSVLITEEEYKAGVRANWAADTALPEMTPEPETEPENPCPICGAEVYSDHGRLFCWQNPFDHRVTRKDVSDEVSSIGFIQRRDYRVSCTAHKSWARFRRRYPTLEAYLTKHPGPVGRQVFGRHFSIMPPPGPNGQYRPQWLSYCETAKRAGLTPIDYETFARRLHARRARLPTG